MRKLLTFRLFIMCICFSVIFAGTSFGAGRQEMKRLGVFLSNFTEAGLFNFDIKKDFDDGENEREGDTVLHLGMPENVTELVRFGIVHNLINNYKSRIRKCKDPNCESGALTIDKKFVAESVRKYFGLELSNKDFNAVADDVTAEFSYDGKLLHFNADSFKEPDNDIVYYAEVHDVDAEGRYTALSGEIYDSKKPTRKFGTFSAFVVPSKWQGKDSWLIISMKTKWSR